MISGVSSQNFNDVFTTTYDTYEIVFSTTGSTSANVNLRFRTAGVDFSSSLYQRTVTVVNNTPTLTVSKSTNQNTLAGAHVMQASPNYSVFRVKNPAQSVITTGYYALAYDSSTTDIRWEQTFFGVNSTNSFDGFSITPTSGTISGSISVYAYNV